MPFMSDRLTITSYVCGAESARPLKHYCLTYCPNQKDLFGVVHELIVCGPTCMWLYEDDEVLTYLFGDNKMTHL